jgi:hypothetical protein
VNPSDNPAEPGHATFFRDDLKVDPDATTFTSGDKENDCTRPSPNADCTTTTQTDGTVTSTTPWHIVSGSVPPQKDDLFDIYSYVRIDGANADVVLGAIRTNSNGDSHIDYELNKLAWEACPGSPSTQCPRRAEGDLLVSYEISNTTPTLVRFFRWDLPGGIDAGIVNGVNRHGTGQTQTTGCDGQFSDGPAVKSCPWEEVALPASAVVSVINTVGGIAAPPWGSRNPDGSATSTLSQFAFFETFLDFDALGLGPSCPGFAVASAKARSSTAIDSAIHDLAGPFSIDLNTCGKITIIKDTVPNAAQDFGYTTAVVTPGATLSPATFSLDDDSDNTLSDTRVYNQVTPGSYSVIETQVTGYDLTSLTCTATTGSSGAQDGVNPLKANITVANLGEVTCTFQNTLRRSLIITKVAKDASTAATGNEPLGGVTFVISPDPTDGVGTLSVTDLFAGEASGTDQFRLAATGKGKICVDVSGSVAGTFSITETVPTGYEVVAPNPKTSVAATTGTCATRGTSATADAAFVNNPQSKFTIDFDALATGASGPATAASITCTGLTPDPADATPSPSVFDDNIEVYTSLDEGTYSCTIVIDP